MSSSHRLPSLDESVRGLVRDEVAAARSGAPPAWEWVSCSALDMTSRSALRLARKEGLRATRLAGRVYLHRADLDRVAAENAVKLDAEVTDDGQDERDAEFVASVLGKKRSA